MVRVAQTLHSARKRYRESQAVESEDSSDADLDMGMEIDEFEHKEVQATGGPKFYDT